MIEISFLVSTSEDTTYLITVYKPIWQRYSMRQKLVDYTVVV